MDSTQFSRTGQRQAGTALSAGTSFWRSTVAADGAVFDALIVPDHEEQWVVEGGLGGSTPTGAAAGPTVIDPPECVGEKWAPRSKSLLTAGMNGFIAGNNAISRRTRFHPS
jgi:hypothetical protein